MSNFIKIVRNYENICKIGREIISHKELLKHTTPINIDYEFHKQEERIQDFIELTKSTHDDWDKNQTSINEYWTGWS